MTEPPSPAARLSLRIDFANGERLGPGKVMLLEAIEAEGSISAAGRRLGMSYRRAWLLVDALNGMFEGPLVGSQQGGSGGGGASLTPLGHEIVRLYRQIEADALQSSAARLENLARQTRNRVQKTGIEESEQNERMVGEVGLEPTKA